MASLRQRFRVSWDGHEPVTVLTTVQDLINAIDRVAETGQVNNRIAMHAALMYSALERSEYDVPAYADWVNLLDSYEEVASPNGTTGPTSPEPLGTEPSLSGSLPARIGVVGLTKTQEP